MKKSIIKMLGLTIACMSLTITLASCNEKNESAISSIDNSCLIPKNQEIQNTTGQTTNNDKTYEYPIEYKSVSMPIITESSETSLSNTIEQTVEKVYDSVVSIECELSNGTASGSGVLFASDNDEGLSYIVTCFHVIESAYNFTITLSDNTTYNASLVGGYSDLDLAVLSIEKTGLTYASFYSNSDDLHLGSSVVCIGNPLGTLPGSVSIGVISYVNRHVQTDTYTTRTLIQTDVAINSGNSGGALFNTSGNLIGIVNAKYSSSGIEGLGFAIPINDVKYTIEKLFEHAQYDSNNKIWNAGYIEGDYELGFTISSGISGYGFNTYYVAYISEFTNEGTYSSGAFQLQDIITSLTIDYLDDSMTDLSISSVNTADDIYQLIYANQLSLGDKLIFTALRSVNRVTTSVTITVEIQQFIYSIY